MTELNRDESIDSLRAEVERLKALLASLAFRISCQWCAEVEAQESASEFFGSTTKELAEMLYKLEKTNG